jgi:hypothetical protein
MENSKAIVKKAGILPRLKLAVKLEGGGTKGTGAHRVKLIEDKVVKGKNFQTGEEREEVKYTVEEDGEKKTYNTPLKNKNGEISYLVQKMAEFKEGEEVVMEYKNKGAKGFIDVRRVDEKGDEEPPIVEEEL